MRFINATLNYICKSNEEVGIWTECIISDIVKIPFKSSRVYINKQSYPVKLKRDLEVSLKPILKGLNIKHHLGNKNTYYDFKTSLNDSVSIKTNISGNKICAQTIGQTTLSSFNKITGKDYKTNDEYKRAVFENPKDMINLYIHYLFCCDHSISIKYDKGDIFYFKKDGNVSLKGDFKFKFSKTIDDWNNSMTLSVCIDNVFKSFAEFQIHSTRNCIKCRFNTDTLVIMVGNSMLENLELSHYKLKYKYNIKVDKNYETEIETEIETETEE
jgi:hypothetical protein